MDRMTVNMIAGAILSSLLVIFGMNTFVNIVYPRGGAPEAPIETAHDATPAAGPAAEPAQPLPVLLAAANVEAGAAQAKKCASCHSFEQGGPNKIGPDRAPGTYLQDQIGFEKEFCYPAGCSGNGCWKHADQPKGTICIC
jgi:cytochrome c